jgi:hypothetical protein
MKAYIDGDIVKYRCAAAAEKTKYVVQVPDRPGSSWKPADDHKHAKHIAERDAGFIWTRKEVQPIENALQAAKTCMDAILRGFDSYVVYLSGATNFRSDVAVTKPYKGNRDRAKDPIYKQDVEEYLIREYGAVRVSDIEADDAIGIALTRDPNGCAVTIDKDLDQIAGWHFNWVSDSLYEISRKDADFNLYSQVLSGDSTDNIPGIEGIGPVKARQILDGSKNSLELATRTWNVYRDHIDGFQGAQAYFTEQFQLVYIRREEVFDWNTVLPKGFTFE